MPLPSVTKDEFFKQLSPEIHGQVDKMLGRDGVTGACYFENKQMDSSAFGQGNVLIFGPACTYKTAADLERIWLGDLPSQRQHPVNIYVKPVA